MALSRAAMSISPLRVGGYHVVASRRAIMSASVPVPQQRSSSERELAAVRAKERLVEIREALVIHVSGAARRTRGRARRRRSFLVGSRFGVCARGLVKTELAGGP